MHVMQELERLRAYNGRLQEAVISAHVRGLPENCVYEDPITSLDLLAAECTTLRAEVAQLARMGGEYSRLYSETLDLYNAVLGPMLTRRRAAQDAEHGGPVHDDTHTPREWAEFIRKFAGRAEYQGQFQTAATVARYQEAMIDVAGLAISAVLSSQRKVSAPVVKDSLTTEKP